MCRLNSNFAIQSTFNFKTMTDSQKHLQNISEIRSIMEKSSSFLSLSGLSGVFAGIFGLLGAAFAYWYIYIYYQSASSVLLFTNLSLRYEILAIMLLDASIVLILSFAVGFIFTYRNSKKKGLKIWDNTTRRLLINLAIPLFTGGIFTLILLGRGNIYLVAASTLIFYGLALVNASKYTLRDIRYLGICEIILGLLAALFIGYGLLFWALGFGLLHIIYGGVMYYKYEK